MSDFLDNLAARNLNLANTAQPRLASRFEPAPSIGAPALVFPHEGALDDSAIEIEERNDGLETGDWSPISEATGARREQKPASQPSTRRSPKTEPKQELPGAVAHETEIEPRSHREGHEISPRHDRVPANQVPAATSRRHFDKPEPFTESSFEKSTQLTSSAIMEPRSEASLIVEEKIIVEGYEMSPRHDRAPTSQASVAARRRHFDKPEPFTESGFEESTRRTSTAITEPQSEASLIVKEKIIVEGDEISPRHDRDHTRQAPVAARRDHFDKPGPFTESGFEKPAQLTSSAITELRSEDSSIVEEKIIMERSFSDSPFIARREDRGGDGGRRREGRGGDRGRMAGPLQSAVEPATRRTGVESESETATAKPAPEVSKKIVAEPRVSLYVEPRRADLTAQPPSAPEAPVINVTIGRVEVRANVTSAPSPKPRPAPKTMSLDEYLRQRANGGNR